MPEVEREDHGSRRRYVIRRPEGEAELTLSVLSPVRVIADHTLVPKALRGGGLARRMAVEERVLSGNPAFATYRAKVRWRLLPGIW